jgi:hypothetical protein
MASLAQSGLATGEARGEERALPIKSPFLGGVEAVWGELKKRRKYPEISLVDSRI